MMDNNEEKLLAMIHLAKSDIPRSPSVLIALGDDDHPTSYNGPYPAIVIDVRLGGANREHYQDDIDRFMEKGGIEFSEDDFTDNSYAYFIRSMPGATHEDGKTNNGASK